ncbi:TPA: sulfatase-like hydrolase/transferase [Legionella pneumophila subsp. pneumophila]|uniref:sulfatase-like hydrolase/transferase n=1 Tax=Legionella pneumophila TaxID=446 RepID=UPI000770B0A5|nr:sulfatase-like hydrolase/transferase [Legionella pneumophila]HAT8862152.1 sulfatase-like hydrolase/transferase [Legionella pneumophila subsp. pneumophila]CZI75159.1 arylsulfatase [Legionella pneumophila]HAT9215000.1 sulfatase-like hydrolase/transferase [Legionella pneumophila subsp. pneumophila]HAT9261956.1 sulfatase-like hydrolase/transferase [Legionella pneumophila subsp. pneumophila]HAT9282871.1 sulfatase-like hydrolase/transferase [Legionella pneumophila subsp. pneumophila]
MKKKHSIFAYFSQFLLFNLCFFGLQLLLLYSHAESLISSIKLPLPIYFEIIGTLVIQFSLYIIISMIQAMLLIGILNRSWHYFSTEQWQTIIWSLFACAILSANAYYFPLSVFSKLFSPPIPEFIFLILLYFSLACLGLLLLNCLFYRMTARLLSIALPISICIFLLNNYWQSSLNPNVASEPNVIILGIDSLSPESVTSRNMPFLHQVLLDSFQFTNTISPLARTYPAWSSILTGLYPKHHLAEENLVERSRVKSQLSIVWDLNKLGYNTIYATDDRRFNSIDENFGFKKIIGPKTGVNDVMLGSYNDFPLGNLLINFRISAWLFPYNFSNRASFISYYPETFTNELKRELSLQQNSPVFLAVHFALPHWPYAWAASLPDQVENEFSLSKRDALYLRALKAVDNQFKVIFCYLKKHGYFKNSLVIILSDHGEVLYYPNSRLTSYQKYQSSLTSKLAEYFKAKTATELDKSAGHGSDILSPMQYHSLLAFNVYKDGKPLTKTNKIKTRVALFDLAPTILDFLNITKKQKMDGISLLPTVLNPNTPLPHRTFFIESGMYPNQDFTKEKAIELGKKIYKVNPDTGQLELRPDELIQVNNQKLYGVISGNWILALYPDDNTYIPVILNLSTGEWIDNLQSDFAKSSPAEKLKRQLQEFYGKKLAYPIQ